MVDVSHTRITNIERVGQDGQTGFKVLNETLEYSCV